MKKFSELTSYPKLHRYEGLVGRIPIRYSNIHLGIEVEAENIGSVNIPGSWKTVEDGSLKVNGMEFITVPIKLKFLEMELRRLFGAIPNAVFSPRTSIHVHMNARDLTTADLHKFMLLYMIFEKSLYKFSGNRWTNNFCVPVYESPKNMPSMLYSLCNNELSTAWSKYMGLNILPLYGADGVGKIGTIEFRHMSGNNNVEYIMDWCNLITCLKFSALKMDGHSIVNAISKHGTISKEFVDSVFGKWSNLIYKDIEWERDISSCTSKTKLIMYKSGAYGMGKDNIKKESSIKSLNEILGQHHLATGLGDIFSIPLHPEAEVGWNIWQTVPDNNS